MAAPNIEELLALDLQTRLVLVQELWESIVQDVGEGAELLISDDERHELDGRVREDDERPEEVTPWSEARIRLDR